MITRAVAPAGQGIDDSFEGVDSDGFTAVSAMGGDARGDGGKDSVAWLRLDDLKKGPAGRGFVEKLESVTDANRVFRYTVRFHTTLRGYYITLMTAILYGASFRNI